MTDVIYKGPYSIASYGEEDGKPKVFRDNDGAIAIMCGDKDSPDYQRVASVSYMGEKGRGKRWNDEDPKSLNFAKHLVACLNAGIDK